MKSKIVGILFAIPSIVGVGWFMFHIAQGMVCPACYVKGGGG